jgi:hypothetical protein
MGKICSGARLFAVDLGEKLATTKYLGRGIELLHALTRIPEAPLEPCLAQPKKAYFIRYEDYEKYGLPPKTDRALSILGAIYASPWFRRVWVVQELVLAREVELRCGRLVIPWDLFEMALSESETWYLPISGDAVKQ